MNNNQQSFGGHKVEQRNIGVCILLSIITCGLYKYYWIYKMNEDLNAVSGRKNDTSGGMVVLFTILTCGVYQWYWIYKAGGKLYAAGQYQNKPIPNSGMMYVIFCFMLYVGTYISYSLIQSELNNLNGLYQ